MINFVKKKDEKGFTLVELAIVLVIIGLILAGIIKGQELITNAKIKRTYSVQKEIAAAIYTYYDRYQFYPGDDRQAAAKFTNPATTNGNGNGVIDTGAGPGVVDTAANFACTVTGTEQCDLWSELRQSGILTGSGFINPTNPYGGAIAVSYTAGYLGASAINWIHLQSIPYEVCQLIDVQFDDGVLAGGGSTGAATGSIQGTANYMTAATGVFQIGFRL